MIFCIKKTNKKLGFSVIELLVVIIIITLIISVLISRQSTFQNRFKTDDKVYDLAIALKKAQNYTLGVREFTCLNNNLKTFDVSYGVNINIDTPNQFTYFVDLNKNGIYDEDTALSCYTETVLLGSPGIDEICGIFSNGSQECHSSSQSTSQLRQISVTFNRPNPKPIINFLGNESDDAPIPSLQNQGAYARVFFRYTNDPGRVELNIYNTGQIYTRYVP